MVKTACGLDCPDACGIISNGDIFPKVLADREHPTSNGTLCSIINHHIHREDRLKTPMVDGREVSMEEALDSVAEALSMDRKLLWRGSGNFGAMQEVTNLLFKAIGGTLTKGSLCDGAGDAGILEGRGVNRILPPSQIAKSDVVVVWGKNITVTASHLMPYIEGKRLIVIDPVEIDIAKRADIFLQIRPRTDFYLAILLARFIMMQNYEDRGYLEEFGSDYDDFYDFTREFRIKPILEQIGADLHILGDIVEEIVGKRVVLLVGNGVQKYSIGSYVLQAIDSLATILGLFGREGSGVAFLGNSKLGIDNPFDVNLERVQKATTEFSRFDTVLIQGGNPLESMPSSGRVKEELSKVKRVIYFGLYENETSKVADIIIPAKSFFEKDDVRFSYASYIVTPMRKIVESDIGISEYGFSKYLMNKINYIDLKDERHYIDNFLNQCRRVGDYYLSPAHQDIPYSGGFGESGGDEFQFIEDFYDDFEQIKRFQRVTKSKKGREVGYFLTTPKGRNGLNSQFKRDNRVYLNPKLGFSDGDRVKVISPYGEAQFNVQNSYTIRDDSVVIYANSIGVNRVTPPIVAEEGNSACYQEVRVILKKV
ncbi:MAG: molybdopterin-dependent oxidoreductase [Epsilonproteobacteria bacterium]|nr:molybdopterin-dependent oxidoreductase [Campylobacterota bacterium]